MELLQTDLRNHPATIAWRSLGPERPVPQQITVLKPPYQKSAVYRLDGVEESGAAVIAKRCARATVTVESTVYERILPHIPHPTLRFYGSLDEPDLESAWMFIQDAGGVPYSTREPDHQVLAARWLAVLHTSAEPLQNQVALPDRGLDHYYRDILGPAKDVLTAVRRNSAFDSEDFLLLERLASRCDVVRSHWSTIHDLWRELPRTFVHGGFYGKNAHVGRQEGHQVLLAFDFESAGWGVPAIDLAHENLVVYHAEIQHRWPGVTLELLARAAAIGRSLWALKSIIGEESVLNSPWVRKAMDKMRYYDGELAKAIASVGWGP